ncbi:MAG TPA: RHS repeat-associated core domain-containing protein, partial [Gemmatimonadales bacterium]|nr:RHS repeat-associated core domain-containing protein [Gemmatimonadales bacterium]
MSTREFWFTGATSPLTPGASDDLYLYALIDPCDPPREIMIGWYDGSWEHRAYWGENLFNYGTPGTGRFAFGAIPAAGQWVRLEVPAQVMNLVNKSITGMAFSVYGGRAWFDRAGKRSCSTATVAAPAVSPLENVWFDDAAPSGAVLRGTWSWDNQQRASGTVSNTAPPATNAEEHWFDGASTAMNVGTGATLVVYALIDPCDPPREIMIGWYDGSWEHRAYWGEDLFPLGTPGTGRFNMGALPPAGQWMRLEVPASIAHLENRTVAGLAFSVWGGKVWFDRVGVIPAQNAMMSSSMPPSMASASSQPARTSAAMPPRRYSLYTPELNLLAETEMSAGTDLPLAYDYVWFGGEPLAQVETATGAIHWYFNDHLATPLLTTDTQGQIDWRIEREPYGETHTIRTGADRHQPLSLPGQENDNETDRDYNIFRWYRGGWGRYTQPDPLHSSAVSPYAYVDDNPVNWIDAWGLYKHKPGGPYHPSISVRCGPEDSCSQLYEKYAEIEKTIESHKQW